MANEMSIQVDFESKIGKSETVTKFRALVTFSSHDVMLKRAGESAIRTMQTKARNGQFPSGRIVPVIINQENELEFTISAEEKAAALSDDEAMALFEALRKRQEAKMAQTNGLVKEEPKTQKVLPHTR